jgi:hypothetical protein
MRTAWVRIGKQRSALWQRLAAARFGVASSGTHCLAAALYALVRFRYGSLRRGSRGLGFVCCALVRLGVVWRAWTGFAKFSCGLLGLGLVGWGSLRQASSARLGEECSALASSGKPSRALVRCATFSSGQLG